MSILYFDFIPYDRVQLEVFVGNLLANKGFATLNICCVYLWPLIGIITWESLARLEMP